MPIIREKVTPDSIVYTDCWRAYNALDVSDLNITELITQSCLQSKEFISMVLRILESGKAAYEEI